MVRDDAPAIGNAGIFAAAGAAAMVLAAWMRLVSGPAPAWPLIVVICLAAGAMIIVLCRVTMPAALRGPLVLALIATMFLGVVRGDLFGVHALSNRVAQGADQAAEDRAAIQTFATGVPKPSTGSDGADIVLVAGRNGDEGWARDIDAWSSRIGGHAAQDIRIDGWVNEDGSREGLTRIAVDWQITRRFASQHCGRTSSAGRDRASMIQAIVEPMTQAIERTVREGQASCP